MHTYLCASCIEQRNKEKSEETKKRVKKPRKQQTVDNEEYGADIGKFAAKNGNAPAQNNFKNKCPELEESTVRSFKLN